MNIKAEIPIVSFYIAMHGLAHIPGHAHIKRLLT